MVKSILLLNLVWASYSSVALASIKPEELVKTQFKAHKVISDSILLTSKDKKSLSKTAQTLFTKNLYRVLKAVDKQDNILGYGLIDSHIVRTKTQALLFVFDKKNKLLAIELLAFQEPEEYKPKQAYLKDSVSAEQSIPTGATLTYSSIEAAKKRAEALIKFYTKAKTQ